MPSRRKLSPSSNCSSAGGLAGVRLGVVRGISYGLFGAPGEFVGQARGLGAGMIRAYVTGPGG